MEIIDKIIPQGRENYKCYDLIKNILENNNELKKIIEDGFNTGKIVQFDEELLQKFGELNVRWPYNIDEVLLLGGNIGGCTTMAYELSFLFENCFKCAGILPILKGTKNSEDGRHTWMESSDGWIYDTSLMLVIDKKYMKEIGYQENIREKYSSQQFYSQQKEFALDSNLQKGRNK